MLKKDITFPDLDGNPVTRTYYFNLTKEELVTMNFDEEGGMNGYLERIIKADSQAELIKIFKKFIVMSIGRRHEDNIQFVKNQQIVDEFRQSNAYSELFMELATSDTSGVIFFRGIMPADMQKQLDEDPQLQPENIKKTLGVETATEPTEEGQVVPLERPKPAKDMTREELLAAFQSKNQE